MRQKTLFRAGTAAVFAAGIGMCSVTAAVTLSGPTSEHGELEATARVLMVALPIAVGLFALHRPPFERFAMLLVASGVGWFLATLSNSDDAVVYSIGRVSGWCVEVLLIYLMLAFPSGRLEHGVDRALVRGAALLVVTLYLPTALLVEQFPLPVPWTSCNSGCPDNAFMLSGSEPAIVGDLIRPLRELLTLALFAAVALRLAQRVRRASPLGRRMLGPVLGVASFRFGAYCAALLGRAVAPDSD